MARSTLLLFFVCLTSALYFVSAQSVTRCSSNADCTATGCTCNSGLCADLPLAAKNVAQCPTCASNSQCTAGSDDECLSNIGKCSQCATTRAAPAIAKCAAGSTSTSSSGSNTASSPPATGNTSGGSSAIKKCEANSQCFGPGCICSSDSCVDRQLLLSNLSQCPNCASNTDCPSVGDECWMNIKKCKNCAGSAAMPAFQKCSGGGPQTPRQPPQPPQSPQSPQPPQQPRVPQQGTANPGIGGSANAVSKDGSCSADTNCMNGCSCFKQSTSAFCVSKSMMAGGGNCQPVCAQNSESIECVECVVQLARKARKACIPKCISTGFLMKRGLGHAAIRHFGAADVLCIPGLPCGTAGHLLRECTSDGTCKLVSYAQVCQLRGDCVPSNMAVSQLKHSVDWSQYHVSSGDITLSLTSLSADPHASLMAPSRIVAKMTDFLNQVGLGFVCDAVATLPYRLGEVSNTLHFSESL